MWSTRKARRANTCMGVGEGMGVGKGMYGCLDKDTASLAHIGAALASCCRTSEGCVRGDKVLDALRQIYQTGFDSQISTDDLSPIADYFLQAGVMSVTSGPSHTFSTDSLYAFHVPEGISRLDQDWFTRPAEDQSLPSVIHETSNEADEQPKVVSSEWLKRVAPFRRLDDNPNFAEVVKMVVLGLTLLPLRVCICVCLFLIYMCLIVPLRILNPSISRIATRVAARGFLFIIGFWSIEIIDERSEDTYGNKTPAVLVSNHVSYVEVLYFIFADLPSIVVAPTILTAQKHASPFMRMFVKLALNCVWTNTADSTEFCEFLRSYDKALVDPNPKAQYEKVLLFPEGTTSNGSCLLRFNASLFEAGIPVDPVLVSFPFTSFSPAYESVYIFTYIIRLLTQGYNRMQIRYLQRYFPSAAERKDSTLYANHVRTYMANALGVPCSESCHLDKIRYHHQLSGEYARHPLGLLAKLLLVHSSPDFSLAQPYTFIKDICYHSLSGEEGVVAENACIRNLQLMLNPLAELSIGKHTRAGTHTRTHAAMHTNTNHKLDLFLPGETTRLRTNTPRGLPIAIFVHGGGWQRGCRRASSFYMSWRDINLPMYVAQKLFLHCYSNIGASFTRGGIACAVISYRLSSLGLPMILVEATSSLLFNSLFMLVSISLPLRLFLLLWPTLRSPAEHIDTYLNLILWLGPVPVCTKNVHRGLHMLSSVIQYLELLTVGLSTPVLVWACLKTDTLHFHLKYSPDLQPWAPLFFVLLLETVLLLCDTLTSWYVCDESGGPVSSLTFRVSLKISVTLAVVLWLKHMMYGILCRIRETYVRHPQHALDVARAVRWAVIHAPCYGIDPQRIFLCGHSAGGHLAALLATDPSYLECVGLKPEALHGIITMSGVFDLVRLSAVAWQRHLYLTPSFGSDELTWKLASPFWQAQRLGHCKNHDKCEKHSLYTYTHTHTNGVTSYIPPFLIISPSKDFGLEIDSERLYMLLMSKHACVTRRTLKHRTHFDIIYGIQDYIPGTQRDDVMIICDKFIHEHM